MNKKRKINSTYVILEGVIIPLITIKKMKRAYIRLIEKYSYKK